MITNTNVHVTGLNFRVAIRFRLAFLKKQMLGKPTNVSEKALKNKQPTIHWEEE
jgi:hypothetical protein